MTKRRWPPGLNQGLEPIKVRFLLSDDDFARDLTRQFGNREDVLRERLELLLKEYRIPSGPECWYRLSLALAREICPGFRVAAVKGKPAKWTAFERMVLAGEMYRELERGVSSQTEAARNIAGREPWRSFLSSGKWRAAHRPDKGAPLLEQFKKIPSRYRKTGADAYRACVQKNETAEWEELVELINSPPRQAEK